MDAICDAAVSMPDEQIRDLTWSDFAASLPENGLPELVTYLKERRLYVNAPQAEPEEV